MLEEYKKQYTGKSEQFVLVDRLGKVLESDQVLFDIVIGSSIFKLHPFFENLTAIFSSDQQKMDFYCIHLVVEDQLYIVDIKAVVQKEGLLLIIKDLTEHYNSYQAITQTRNESVIKTELTVLKNLELQERERFKNSFIQNFSHELRNPLTSIMAIIEILSDSEMSDEQVKMLDFLKEANTNLRLMLEDTLSIGMIDAGEMKIEQKLFSLHHFFELMQFTYKAKVKRKNLKFVCSIDDKIPEFVEGDRLRLFQIVTNLLDNAVKYTEKGTISFDIKLNQKRANIVSLRFQISDTGPGISKENQEVIFESFHRENRNEQQGVGLGLTIVKRLLELMDSKIHLNSDLEKGSLFYFDIALKYPVLSKSENQIAKPNHKLAVSPLKKTKRKFKLLLVEDDEYVQLTLFKILLNTKKFHIDLAYDGAFVLQEVVSNNYDLILMDVNIPNLNGIQITKLIRDFPYKNIGKVPIIGITANASDENVEQCVKAGMNKVIKKPFDKEELLRTILKVLK